MFGNLVVCVCGKIFNSSDASTADAINKILNTPDSEKIVVRWIFALFCAHEFFHTEQKLDSDTYADSDRFINVVTAADYQADIIAIDYVFRCISRAQSIDQHKHLLLILILIHIAVMQVFSPSASELSMTRAAFDRLLVWHLQGARVAAASSCPDVNHPSLASMPVIAFPLLEPKLGHKVTWANLKSGRQRTGQAPLVLGLGGADSIIRIRRLHATDQKRISTLIHAVLAEDFSSFRDELEEFFKTHDGLQRFDAAIPKHVSDAIERCLAMVDRILKHSTGDGVSSMDDVDVSSLFETISFHLHNGELSGAIWNGVREGIDKLRGQSRLVRGAKKRATTSTSIRQEVQRIEIRLNWTLDQIGR